MAAEDPYYLELLQGLEEPPPPPPPRYGTMADGEGAAPRGAGTLRHLAHLRDHQGSGAGASSPAAVPMPSRHDFMQQLEAFHLSARGGGKPLKVPVFCYTELDLYRVFREVRARGGQGLTLVPFSAQREHILWDTLGA
jgi:hypothetical protein